MIVDISKIKMWSSLFLSENIKQIKKSFNPKQFSIVFFFFFHLALMLKLFSQYIDKFDDDNINVICYYGMMVIKYSCKRFVMFACHMCMHSPPWYRVQAVTSINFLLMWNYPWHYWRLSVCAVYIMCSLYIERDKSMDIFMISRIKLSFFDSYGIICVCIAHTTMMMMMMIYIIYTRELILCAR